MISRDIQKKGFHERFHIDSKGRRWNFTQRRGLRHHWGTSLPSDHEWNRGKLVWVCTSCDGEEPVKWTHFVHDEVIVPDPDDQLSAHSCELEHVLQVHAL